MRHAIARFLQLLGLLILPFGIVSNVVEKVSLVQSLLIAAGGTLVFYIGYILQNRA